MRLKAKILDQGFINLKNFISKEFHFIELIIVPIFHLPNCRVPTQEPLDCKS